MKPRLLDLFCGAGGAATGYHRAGFDVTGVDLYDQPNYPFRFVQTNALTAKFLGNYDVIHASPECQGYCWSTTAARKAGKVYSDDIPAVRELLIESGKPYVIENVPTAPLRNPTYLEGTMFGLNVIRRRGFETNWWLPQPRFRPRRKPIMQESKIHPGKLIQKSAYCTVAGNGADGWSCRLSDWQKAMGIDWMTKEEIIQAIPPAYTEHIGRHLMGALNLIPSNTGELKPSIISRQCRDSKL
jgi:DNA (cytosine-5)-methyltransferase 1